ncbi:MAG: recombination protein RecO [Campylobacterales bacterium]
MQGYILNFNKTREEDLIVSILTPNKLKTLYRFYGARHSYIQIGFKVDFETEISHKAHLPRLRNVLHLPSEYIFSHSKMFCWQGFLRLLYEHLREVEEIDNFYFELLEECSTKLTLQNPKRAILESYVKLLEHEGRLHIKESCHFCQNKIEGEHLAVVRSFLPAHSECVYASEIDKKAFFELMGKKSSMFLSDDEVEILWNTLLLGL